MTTEVICALVTVGGTLLSALIAFFVSRSTANKEIEKMKLTWEREDAIASDEEFGNMAAAVASYVQNPWSGSQNDAITKVAAIRSKVTGRMAIVLSRLYKSIRDNDTQSTEFALTEAYMLQPVNP